MSDAIDERGAHILILGRLRPDARNDLADDLGGKAGPVEVLDPDGRTTHREVLPPGGDPEEGDSERLALRRSP
ncbi:hypothetical protein GCM10009834_41840 [Streptomonospora arabica]